jgi:diguanylate cyclase (GGDEF)-like protein
LRSTDVLGRLGGDEFAILMPQTNDSAAAKLAERVRAAANATPIPVEGGEIRLALSAGVAQWRPESNETSGELLGRADANLYAEKNRRAEI